MLKILLVEDNELNRDLPSRGLARTRRYPWWSWMAISLLSLILRGGGMPALLAQAPTPTPNRVLDLNGNGSYVELPPNIFNDVEVATVEAWVNWGSFQAMSRVFDLVFRNRLASLQNRGTNPDLWVETFASGKRSTVKVTDVLRTNEWVHLAVAVGPEMTKLYFNGVLLSDRLVQDPDMFRSAEFSRSNLLGRSNAKAVYESDADFHGQLDEVRVWRGERTEAQIRETMFQALDGREPGLLGLWNFENVTNDVVKDASPGGHDGALVGQARVTNGQLPDAASLVRLDTVLELPGADSYVELPPDIFNDLDESTFEAWVKWERLGEPGWNRVFNYGSAMHDLTIATRGSNSLWFVVADGGRGLQQIIAPVLKTGEWVHVAGVSGKNGMRLYVSGQLVGTNAYTGSFSGLNSGQLNRLGKTVTQNDKDPSFQGQMDEVRVWRGERTESQIRENMFTRLTGMEPDLVGLWNFDKAEDGLVKDASPGGHAGRLMGSASIVPSRLPGVAEAPSVLEGTVRNAAGGPASQAKVILVLDDRIHRIANADSEGKFKVQLRGAMALQVFALQAKQVAKLAECHVEPFGTTRADLKLEGGESDAKLVGEVKALLVEGLRDRGRSDQDLAAAALSELQISEPGVVAALVSALDDQAATVRRAALSSLANLPIPAALRPVYEKRSRAMSYLFGGLLIPFVVFHLLLFTFFPKVRSNLYFAAYAATAALGTIQQLGINSISPTVADSLPIPVFVLSVVNSMLGLRLLYSFFYERLPRLFWFFLIPGAMGALVAIMAQTNFPLSGGVFRSGSLSSSQVTFVISMAVVGLVSIAVGIEMFRVAGLAIIRRKRGAWIVGGGMVAVLLFPVVGALGNAFFRDFMRDFFGYPFWGYLSHMGVVVFAACASLYLAGDFAQTYRNLASAKEEIERKNRDLAAANRDAEEARATAEEANKAKSSFLANMSHELRTPLNAIIGYSEMLQEEAEDLKRPELIPDLGKIHGAGKHLLGLINDVLDLSKVESGKMSLYLEDFDVTGLLQEVAATVQPLIQKNSNTLVVECPAEIGHDDRRRHQAAPDALQPAEQREQVHRARRHLLDRFNQHSTVRGGGARDKWQ
jgi:hypothetical protein